jgi:hypothetical protein
MVSAVKDWRIELMQAHARLFNLQPAEPDHSFGYPNCKDGWQDILERLCTKVENALRTDETFEFTRIKQKFGIARIDWDCEVSDETGTRIGEAIDHAVARSATSCEICGAEGRLYCSRGWLATACAEHAAGDPVPVRPGFENVRLLRRRPGAPEMYHARYDRETDSFTEVSLPLPDPEDSDGAI